MQVGGQLPSAHLGCAQASSHVAEIEESLRVTFLFLDHDAEDTRQNIFELVGALIGMSEVGSQHGVEPNATESPAARRQRMARTRSLSVSILRINIPALREVCDSK